MARSAKLIIMTDERIKEKLQAYAGAMGITTSALGAYILGHWVWQQEKLAGPMLDRLQQTFVGFLEQEMLRSDREAPGEASLDAGGFPLQGLPGPAREGEA